MSSQKKTLTLTESTLKQVRFSGTDKQDILAYYKAYQLGALKKIHDDFDPETLLSKEDFEILFSEFLRVNNLLSVTFFGFRDDIEVPIGVGLFWQRGRVLQLTNLIWFPWITSRQIFLSVYSFLDGVRKTVHSESKRFYKILEFAEKRDEKFFDRFVSMGVLEKIGQIEDLYPDNRAVLYVTKKVEV